jgi:hypothetical protein
MTDQSPEVGPTGRDAEQLPARGAMSLIDEDVAVPVNAAVAASVLSDDATASAVAAQQPGDGVAPPG